MDSINLDKTVTSNDSFQEIFNEYNQLKLDIKDSDVKLRELKRFVGEELFEQYKKIIDINNQNINNFLLENPLLSEYLDELDYNSILKKRMEDILKNKVDLLKLSNGMPCQHEFVKLNNKLLCIKCFIKEEEFNYQYEDLREFLVKIAISQGMYIDEIDESELALLEKARQDFKSLIKNLKKQKESSSQNTQRMDLFIKELEENKTEEYKKSLSKLRKKKLSTKK